MRGDSLILNSGMNGAVKLQVTVQIADHAQIATRTKKLRLLKIPSAVDNVIRV